MNVEWKRVRYSLVVLGSMLGLVGLLGPVPSSAQAEGDFQRDSLEWEVLDQREGQGEVCLVCRQQIYGKDVVELRCEGRTFHVAAGMMSDFEGDPERYFADLQARSGLFDERAVRNASAASRLMSPWLIAGLYIVLGLVFAALCGYLALGRGHAPLPWFFAGLVGNIAAFGVLLASPTGPNAAAPPGLVKVPVTQAPMACPECGAPNHPAAKVCSVCGTTLTPSVEAETARL